MIRILALLLVSSFLCVSAYSQKVSIVNLQEVIDTFESPFVASVEKNSIVLTPKYPLDPVKSAYYLQIIYQAWNYYITTNKVNVNTLELKYLQVITIGNASLQSLEKYKTLNTNNKAIKLSDYFFKN